MLGACGNGGALGGDIFEWIRRAVKLRGGNGREREGAIRK